MDQDSLIIRPPGLPSSLTSTNCSQRGSGDRGQRLGLLCGRSLSNPKFGVRRANWATQARAFNQATRAFFLSNRLIRFSKNNPQKYLSGCLADLTCGALALFFRLLLVENIAQYCKLKPLNKRGDGNIKLDK